MTWCVMVLALVTADTSDQVVVPLQQDKPAPFAGLLVPEARFVELLEAEQARRELEVKLKAAEQTSVAIEQVYQAKLRDAVAVPWYDSPSFNRWLGIFVGGAITGMAVWAVVELQAANH